MNTTTPATVTPRQMKGVNWIGLKTFIRKETSRFLNVYMQTLIAPLVTLFLFFIVFNLALSGGQGAEARQLLGVPYVAFLAPGLLMMTMIQNAFANPSSSLMIAKVHGFATLSWRLRNVEMSVQSVFGKVAGASVFIVALKWDTRAVSHRYKARQKIFSLQVP